MAIRTCGSCGNEIILGLSARVHVPVKCVHYYKNPFFARIRVWITIKFFFFEVFIFTLFPEIANSKSPKKVVKRSFLMF